jgi:preprotein translocase subunit SecA
VIPPNRSLIRTNHPDVVYKTEQEKFTAACEEIAQCYASGQPALVGTISIEKSERLSRMLKKSGVPHQVLNAKYHEKEAEIIAQAGRFQSVTIATNMAGRGTDILLGGNVEYLSKEFLRKKGLDPLTAPEEEKQRAREEARKITEPEHQKVVELGGLHIIGTERHESRRIDNQLRGRAGRQGDPGSSRFYLSLEDDLLRIFGSERISKIMDRLGMEEGEPIEHKLVSRAIQTAQKRVETHNFEIRKHLLEYDDVMNKQREIIYGMRREILSGESQEETILEWLEEIFDGLLATYAPESAHPEDWDVSGLSEALHRQFDVRVPPEVQQREVLSYDGLRELTWEAVQNRYRAREQELGSETMRHIERGVMLQVIDTQWKDHLLSMDHLKEGIGLRGYGQRDPLTEYKREAFDLFTEMVDRIKTTAVEWLFKVQLVRESEPERRNPWADAVEHRGEAAATASSTAAPRHAGQKVGRNDPCPCGSGKKYKRCCLLKAS